ncbi:4-(cytidine 5'-diphospho)-2-C-methyl-D-erythritol kinase [Rhizorhabdus sp. FW153]|uniref:4-(cytidine 5'-diphospho)-2-C-methyl-D-erythritol kinase n=1 Tax=Rhizorhabdus sp. FW153 TaxID=3400216 RepID=UPI003CEA746D
MTDSEIAFAKINLALHVRRRREDGYHELETIFAFARHGDLVSIAEGPPRLTIDGPFADILRGEDPEDNLVMRAARGLYRLAGAGTPPAIHLDKRLPVAAGIGGGSADAAAVLRLLCRRLGLSTDAPEVLALAAELGADVPACLMSQSVRGDARGDVLAPVDGSGLCDMPLLLVNPGVPLSTGPVFKAWDGVDHGPLASGDPLEAALAGRNDLEPPALRLCPVIGDVIERLAAQPGCTLARMSGSGATCFALFENSEQRDTASEVIGVKQSGWWRLASGLR